MLPNVIQWIPMMISTMFHNQTFIKLAFFCSLGQPVQGIATCTTVHFNLLHTCNYTLVPRLPLLAEVRWVGPKGAHTANYCKHKALHSLDSILLTVAVWTWTTKPSYIYKSSPNKTLRHIYWLHAVQAIFSVPKWKTWSAIGQMYTQEHLWNPIKESGNPRYVLVEK